MQRGGSTRCTRIDALPGISTPRWNPGRVWYLIPERPFSGVEGAVAGVPLRYGGWRVYNVHPRATWLYKCGVHLRVD